MLGKGSLFVEAPHLLKPEMQFDSFFFPILLGREWKIT